MGQSQAFTEPLGKEGELGGIAGLAVELSGVLRWGPNPIIVRIRKHPTIDKMNFFIIFPLTFN